MCSSVHAKLCNEIEWLRRERDELRELVRQQEADLTPRAGGHGPSAGGRTRSLDMRLDLERLQSAQEATAAMQHLARHASQPLGQPHTQPCTCHAAAPRFQTSPRRQHSPEPMSRPRLQNGSNSARGRYGESVRRHRPCSGSVPVVGGLPRGSGRRGPGYPEGSGSGPRRSPSMPARRPTPPWTPHPQPQPSKQPPALPVQPEMMATIPRLGHAARAGSLEDTLGEALRGLDGARGALADASKQLSQEAHRRSSEAWRLHRLEQVVAASLGGFGRELRGLHAENARRNGEAGHRARCHSCTR